MRRTAVSIIIAGLVFVYFNIPFAGTDILIDAVGWLVVWNAVRALQKIDKVYYFAPQAAFALIIVSAFEMFASGGMLRIAVISASILELVFWAMLVRGLYKLTLDSGTKLQHIILAAGFIFALLPPVIYAVANIQTQQPSYGSAAVFAIYIMHILVLIVMFAARTMVGKLDEYNRA